MDFSNLSPDSDTNTNATEVVSDEKLAGLPETLPIKALDERVVDYVAISEAHQQFAKQQAEEFDILDTNSVMMFAFKAQQEYTESLKVLLSDSKVRDLGVGAQIIQKIRSGLDIAEVDKMKQEVALGDKKKGFLESIGLKKVSSAFTQWETKKVKLHDLVEEVETTIQAQMDSLIKENARLDVLLQEVRNNFYQLGIYLYAGELIVERGAQQYTVTRTKAIDSGDALFISDLTLLKGQMNAFDSRLLEIKKAYVSAPVEMQNILTTQQAARIEMQTQMNSLLFTVPKLIKSLIQLVSLYNIKNAQTVRDSHNQLNAELDSLAGSTLEEVSVNAQQAVIDAAQEAQKIEVQANETIALAMKLAEGSKTIETAQQNADKTLAKVMKDFQVALTENSAKTLS